MYVYSKNVSNLNVNRNHFNSPDKKIGENFKR